VIGVDNPDNAAAISRTVDNVFKNSLAETLTETEQAFQLGFVAMSNQIIAAIRVVSYVVIVIVMAVMANAMAMSARERITEYATLKALGFGPGFLSMLVFGESLIISAFGGGLGMLLTPPAAILQAGRGRRISGLHRVARHHGHAGRVRAGGRPGGRHRPRGAGGARAHRRGPAGHRVIRMVIPLHYIARNVWARRLTTTLTAGGLALVVFVFATMLMLDAGLKRTLVTTGERDNVVLIRKGAETEIQSAISRDQAAAMEMHPAVALTPEGRPMSSREAVVLISLTKTGYTTPSNVVIRGITPLGVEMRPQVRLTGDACSSRVRRKSSSAAASPRVMTTSASATICDLPSATGPWLATSTLAAAGSIPRSGAMWTS
jgi:hypothetical protein